MYYGVQYYPEHWPETRWPIDAVMMQRAGVNTVRMGEFAWSALEPQSGQYHFEWLERAIDLLHRHGIQTILCTPSRTPPPWVFQRFPGVLNTRLLLLSWHRLPGSSCGFSFPAIWSRSTLGLLLHPRPQYRPVRYFWVWEYCYCVLSPRLQLSPRPSGVYPWRFPVDLFLDQRSSPVGSNHRAPMGFPGH